MVLPYCVDMHRGCCCKQRFSSQSSWQYCFPFAASDVKLSLLSRPFTISFLSVCFPLGVKCLTPAPRRLLMSASSPLPAMCFSKLSLLLHRPSCLRRDFCKCLLGYFVIPFKSLLDSPLPAGMAPTVSLLMCYDYCQYGPTVSVRSPVCIHLFSLLLHSGYAYAPVTVAGEWQKNWSNFTLATEDTSSWVLSVGGPCLVLGYSTALALARGSRHPHQLITS